MLANLNRAQARAALDLMQRHQGQPVRIENGTPHNQSASARVLTFDTDGPTYFVSTLGHVTADSETAGHHPEAITVGTGETPPVVLIVRDPDSANEITTWPGTGEVVALDIDLGSGFDGTPDDAEQAREWRESMAATWDASGLDALHPARAAFWAVVDQTAPEQTEQACPLTSLDDDGDVREGCGEIFHADPDEDGHVSCPSCGLTYDPSNITPA